MEKCRCLKTLVLVIFAFLPILKIHAQINTERVLLMGRNALFYEDYVLAIQRFNMVISAKPWLGEPYFYRGLAKFYLEDYQGAEIDCDNAVERNPFSLNNYSLRALCKVNQGKYASAEEDYNEALSINPLEKNCWHNIVLCQMELQNYERADSSLDVMIRNWPKETENYTLKAQVAMSLKDTVRAEKWIDTALGYDAFEGKVWSMKAVFQSSREEYAEAEESLDKAIVQMPKVSGLYINRALARYNQDNLRGAMSDYDAAIELEPNNYLGHYNRGLLRTTVGEDNLAIEDFNFVLGLEPTNTIALYNRAILLENVGDYKGAVRDISNVLKDYPDFWEGYRRRASILRKIGDVGGAERDEFKLLKARMAVATGTYKSSGKTRKMSEHNIEDYQKLVEEDSHETENEYASEYRGRVQNHHTDLKVDNIYVLTYYKHSSDVKLYNAYSKEVDALNNRHILPVQLFLADDENAMSQRQANARLRSISMLSEKLEAKPDSCELLMARALDYYHVHDFDNAIADMNSLLQKRADDVLALVLRAQCRYAQLRVDGSTANASDQRLGYLMTLQDYAKAQEMTPDAPYLLYNIGCVKMQLSDYEGASQAFSAAVGMDEQFPDAYFGLGVALILQDKVPDGLANLSKAGEKGLYSAYNLIKKYSKEKK